MASYLYCRVHFDPPGIFSCCTQACSLGSSLSSILEIKSFSSYPSRVNFSLHSVCWLFVCVLKEISYLHFECQHSSILSKISFVCLFKLWGMISHFCQKRMNRPYLLNALWEFSPGHVLIGLIFLRHCNSFVSSSVTGV